jgi:hypothetical protein
MPSEPATKPKHFLMFQSDASMQKDGDVVPQQSSTRTTIVAKEMRIRQRVENALVRVDAACLPAGSSPAGIPVRRWRLDDLFRKLTP